MTHTIQFRGKTLTYNIERGVNKNFISEVNGVQTKKLCSLGHETNNNSEVLSLEYLQLIEVDGEVIAGSNVVKPKISVFGSYDKFLYMNGAFNGLIKAELNFISEVEYSNQCIAFNPLDNFTPIQPVTMDFVTTETGVTVNIIDEPIDSSLVYCIGDPQSLSANWLPLPENEIPLPYGVYSFFVMNDMDGYPFGGVDAFTITQ